MAKTATFQLPLRQLDKLHWGVLANIRTWIQHLNGWQILRYVLFRNISFRTLQNEPQISTSLYRHSRSKGEKSSTKINSLFMKRWSRIIFHISKCTAFGDKCWDIHLTSSRNNIFLEVVLEWHTKYIMYISLLKDLGENLLNVSHFICINDKIVYQFSEAIQILLKEMY